jgi:iron complex outermembrane recepter protein
MGVVTVKAQRPSSLPTHIPATMSGVSAEQLAKNVNASDSEDALKYLPSLTVRKRYIGDYNHAVLSSRASGTGNSARSLVYADGMLLSNLLGNGATYAPRWGMVTPEEIERVDVMYGAFSAAYPGNAVGAVVDFATRMPTQFEAHAKTGLYIQPNTLYGASSTYQGWQSSASVGNRAGDWAWWLNATHTDSKGQPQTFVTRAAPPTGVTGAVQSTDRNGNTWYILGSGTQYSTQQEHLKTKLAYDFSPTVRLFYTLGYWQNSTNGHAQSYLRDAAGNAIYGGGGYTGSQALSGADFAVSQDRQTHMMHGLTLKRNTQGEWDWQLNASLYNYAKDEQRKNASNNNYPKALEGGTGTLADGRGTRWDALAARATWRPSAAKGKHVLDFGWQQDSYHLRNLISNTSPWMSSDAGAVASEVSGKTQLRSLWAQDTWRVTPRWKTVLGLRLEDWQASSGYTAFSASSSTSYPERREAFVSPKAALSYQAAPDVVLKSALARAVRMPTVSELYGATSTTNSAYINDPNLSPEKSWTGEWSVEKIFDAGSARLSYFAENTRQALYSQTIYDPAANKTIGRVQNVGLMQTRGLELFAQGDDVGAALGLRGLSLQGSATYTQSLIKQNDGYVASPGDTIDKRQPRIPVWRASAVLGYQVNPQWHVAYGARYSGQQFSTLNNSDTNGFAYQGASNYLVSDLRLRYQISQHWRAAAGIDNLGNQQYWNFHPYPQRTYSAELSAGF